MKKRLMLLAVVTTIAGLPVWNLRAYLLLPWYERKFERQFPVTRIDSASLAALLESGPGGLLLLDTRSVREYRMSRIGGAQQVDWQINEEEFNRRYSAIVRGRYVVLYCSVGYRSSAMLQRLGACIQSAGALRAANRNGGIFGWYNRGLPVVDSAGGATDNIHPFDKKWGQMVKQR